MNYKNDPLDRSTLTRIVEAVPNPPADMVRKDNLFSELGLDEADYRTTDEVVDLLVEHGLLMQRPVIFRGDRAVIGRPPETVRELLD